MNCWRCNGTGWYGGVDGNHFECNHPPDTREYTDKGYLIMGIVNKYDEALEKLELLRLRASSHVDISNCKKTMQDWIDSDAEFIKESLTKAKAFDVVLEAKEDIQTVINMCEELTGIQQIARTLNLFRSIIMGRENWTETCRLEYEKAHTALLKVGEKDMDIAELKAKDTLRELAFNTGIKILKDRIVNLEKQLERKIHDC